MSLRDLPVKYVWVHRGGKTFPQRYHFQPTEVVRSIGLVDAVETVILEGKPLSFINDAPKQYPPRVYPIAEMRDPGAVARRMLVDATDASMSYWLFPTRQIYYPPTALVAKSLPYVAHFIEQLFTYGSAAEAAHVITAIGMHLMSDTKPMCQNHTLWNAIGLNRHALWEWVHASSYKRTYWAPANQPLERGIYIVIDPSFALAHASLWLPLLTQFTGLQIAWQMRTAYTLKVPAKSWLDKSHRLAVNDEWKTFDTMLCIPQIADHVQQVITQWEPEVPGLSDYHMQVLNHLKPLINQHSPESNERAYNDLLRGQA